jgi:hypothetical protein
VTLPRDSADRAAGNRRPPALEITSILLGVLVFCWGFLDWWGTPTGGGQNGYRLLDGYPPVSFALLAALLTALNLRADRTERTALLAIGASFVGLVFTVLSMVVKPTVLLFLEDFSSFGDSTQGLNLTVRIGLVLALITTVLQTGCLVLAWLRATGRIELAGVVGPRGGESRRGQDGPPEVPWTAPWTESVEPIVWEVPTPPPGTGPPTNGTPPAPPSYGSRSGPPMQPAAWDEWRDPYTPPDR